jgi:SAM-dependent methyltransferase
MLPVTTPFENRLGELDCLGLRARRFMEWQRQLAVKELGQRIVEVGSGTGDLTRRLLSREQVIAVDERPERVARLLSKFVGVGNLEVLSLHVTAAKFRELASFRPDSVVCLHDLARVDDDLLALFNMSSVLPPGGRIVLVVPAFPRLYGHVDFALGYLRRYTKDSLAATAARVGLRVKRLHYSNLFGFFGWWLRSRLALQELPPEQEGETGSVTTPLLARIEGMLAPPFGQDLFAVFERP